MGRKWHGNGRHRSPLVCARCGETDNLTIWHDLATDHEHALCLDHLLGVARRAGWGS